MESLNFMLLNMRVFVVKGSCRVSNFGLRRKKFFFSLFCLRLWLSECL